MQHTVLSSGPEFFSDLLNEISHAQTHIYIHAFLWRNDTTGQTIAKALLSAANRGVVIHVTKDRIGAFFEYAEGNGQSFFHDTPQSDPIFNTHSTRTILYQAKMMAKLYGHTPKVQKLNNLLKKLKNHTNIHITDTYKLYDHSKVIVIDKKVSYVGGIGFGDEFNSQEKSWIDFMCKSVSVRIAHSLLNLPLTQDPETNTCIVNNKVCLENNTTLDKNLEHFLHDTNTNVTLAMSFLGKVSHIQILVSLLHRGIYVHVITAENAHSNQYRNRHFIKRLIREAGESVEFLTVTLTENMLHGKLILRDNKTARLGSQNMTLDCSVVQDVVIESEQPSMYISAQKTLTAQLSNTKSFTYTGAVETQIFTNQHSWTQILLPSRTEWLASKLQSIVVWTRRSTVEARRQSLIIEVHQLLEIKRS